MTEETTVQLTEAQIANLIEAVAQRIAANTDRSAEKKISENALSRIRGQVVSRNADGQLQIRRYTSVSDDGSPGDPDPAHYDLVGSPSVPSVGEEVWGLADTGGVTLLGSATRFPDIPLGAMMPYTMPADPTDPRWLVADGRVVNQADYPDYYAGVGSTYNTGGEPAGTFRIPDTRGRALAGAGQGDGLTNRVLGTRFGAEAHTLTVAELAAHSHTGSTDLEGHWHGLNNLISDLYVSDRDDVQTYGNTSPITSLAWTTNSGTNTDYHSHSVTTNSTGDTTPHNNMPPMLVVRHVIRVLP